MRTPSLRPLLLPLLLAAASAAQAWPASHFHAVSWLLAVLHRLLQTAPAAR